METPRSEDAVAGKTPRDKRLMSSRFSRSRRRHTFGGRGGRSTRAAPHSPQPGLRDRSVTIDALADSLDSLDGKNKSSATTGQACETVMDGWLYKTSRSKSSKTLKGHRLHRRFRLTPHSLEYNQLLHKLPSGLDQYPPLCSRVVRSTTKCATNPVQTPSHHSLKGYKNWDETVMSKAIDAVVNDGLSIRRAATDYGLPKSTLGDRISGRVLPGALSGPKKYLNDEEEKELAHFLLQCAFIGYPRSRQEVIAIAQCLLDEHGITRVISHGWWESFCRRHASLTLRTTAPLSLSRAKASDVGIINKYFDMLEATMKEYGILDKPCQLFNMDESGMPLNPKPLKLVCEKGCKNPIAITGNNKAQVTIVGCVSAAGYCIPPMVIHGGRATITCDLVKDEIPGTLYGVSPKGWMDQQLFYQWLFHFMQYAPPTRPLLLLMDGHSSHYCPSAIHQASEHQIILMALPPNTTHLLQPLDKGVFGPLKIEWRKVCHEYINKNSGKVVTQHSFSPLFAQAWLRSMTMKNIIAAFSTTGVFPINRAKIISQIDVPSAPKQAGGLTFLPLLTPTPFHASSTDISTFTDAEAKLYTERLQMGYDGSDERFKLWLDMYHPRSVALGNSIAFDESVFHTPVPARLSNKGKASTVAAADKGIAITVETSDKETAGTIVAPGMKNANTVALSKPSNLIQKLFDTPAAPSKLPTLKPKQSSRVITSAESIKQLQDKEKKKQEIKLQKEEKQKRLAQRKQDLAEGKEKKARKVKSVSFFEESGEDYTVAELKLFSQRYKNGYDITTDKKYNEWKLKYHPYNCETVDSAAKDSDCATGNCKHKRARNWIECEICKCWYHCICVDVPVKTCKTVSFCCSNCM